MSVKTKLVAVAFVAAAGAMTLAGFNLYAGRANSQALNRVYDSNSRALTQLLQLQRIDALLREVRFRVAGVLLDVMPVQGSLNHLRDARKELDETWRAVVGNRHVARERLDGARGGADGPDPRGARLVDPLNHDVAARRGRHDPPGGERRPERVHRRRSRRRDGHPAAGARRDAGIAAPGRGRGALLCAEHLHDLGRDRAEQFGPFAAHRGAGFLARADRLVDEAGKTMNEIVTSVQRVTDIMAQIATASREQGGGIEQVNRAIAQMDQVTQQNAALVEEASAAAESLKTQAAQLTQAVTVFRVSGDERRSEALAPIRVLPAP